VCKTQGSPSPARQPALCGVWVDLACRDEAYAVARQRTASEVMTREVPCVQVFDDLVVAVTLMADRELERLPVVRHGELVGMLSRSDILRLWATTGAAQA
jgi:signal-transduction protein with cAMP-binding, CBS, and nucleotidyltransferase domain